MPTPLVANTPWHK